MNKRKSDPVYRVAKQLVKQALPDDQTLSPTNKQTVHKLRVLSKQLRALLQIYRPDLDTEVIKPLEKQLQGFAKDYASLRDNIVMQETLDMLLQRFALDDQAEAQLLREYFAQRPKAVAETTPDNPVERLELILKQWKKSLHLQGSDDFTRGIEYSYQKARKLAKKAQSTDLDDNYHECRKWVKYLLYQIDLLAGDLHKAKKRYQRQLKKLAGELGVLHDHCVLEQHLADILIQSQQQEQLCSAATLGLNWVKEQKARDKEICQALFIEVFPAADCPVIA